MKVVLKMNYMLPPRDKNQELCAEYQTSNKAMYGNNYELCDSIVKYAFHLPTLTITIMNLNIFLPKIQVYVLI